jgi:hypothetical protein
MLEIIEDIPGDGGLGGGGPACARGPGEGSPAEERDLGKGGLACELGDLVAMTRTRVPGSIGTGIEEEACTRAWGTQAR